MLTVGDCIFCKIVSGAFPSWIVWEDAKHIAFLTPFPNAAGFTVVVPKEHASSDVLSLSTSEYFDLLGAAKTVSDRLKHALNVKRVGLVIEGMGVDHAHVKLIPMHGIPDGPWKPMLSSRPQYFEEYEGYLSTHEGPRMGDEELTKIQQKILNN